jgi:hypothetical protein
MKIPKEEWPQKGAKGAKKRGLEYSAVFESFVLFCGQNAFLPSAGRLNFRARMTNDARR